MSPAYSAADLTVSRAGAVTLHELAFFGKCAILVPYPGAGGHQLANARVLAGCNAAFLAEERKFDASFLKEKIGLAEREPERIAAMGLNCAAALRTDGARACWPKSL